MITRRDLDKCASLAKEAQNLQESLERLESLAETGKMTCGLTGGNGKPLDDKTGEGASRLADMKARMQKRIVAYVLHAGLVEEAIDSIRDERVRVVMHLYYVCGMIWDEVAERMGYDTRQCRRYRDRGLRILGIMPKDKHVLECPPTSA